MWSGDQKIHAMKNWRDECCGVWWRSNKHGVSGRQSRVVTVGTGSFKSKEQLQLLTRISFGMFVQIVQGRTMESQWLLNNRDAQFKKQATLRPSAAPCVCSPTRTHWTRRCGIQQSSRLSGEQRRSLWIRKVRAVTGAGSEGPTPGAEILHEEEPIQDGGRHRVGAKSDTQLVFQDVLVSVKSR